MENTYSDYVLLAYGVTTVVMLTLSMWHITRYRKQKRMLALLHHEATQ